MQGKTVVIKRRHVRDRRDCSGAACANGRHDRADRQSKSRRKCERGFTKKHQTSPTRLENQNLPAVQSVGEGADADLRRKRMKSLYLLRHAKSSWKDPKLNDHDRPLSKRGRHAAKLMAAYLRRSKIAPDLVICSTATRARQTLDPIIKAAKKQPKILLKREIYGGTQQLWEQLWNLPEAVKSVLLIGHNPALHDLARALAQEDSEKLLPSEGEKFPTGAMASFRFRGAWKALEPQGAVLVSFVTPKAIAGIDTLTTRL